MIKKFSDLINTLNGTVAMTMENKIYKSILVTFFLLISTSVFANSIVEITGVVEYYNEKGQYEGELDSSELPSQHNIPVLEYDQVNGRVKVKLRDGRLVWLDTLDLNLSTDSAVAISCKDLAATTGKRADEYYVNMGFGSCKDV